MNCRAILLVTFFGLTEAAAQVAEFTFENVSHSQVSEGPTFTSWDGSLFSGEKAFRDMNPELSEEEARRQGDFIQYEVIEYTGAEAIVVKFSEFHIGSGSYIAIIGQNDDVEWYDQGTLKSAQGSSRVFSGSKVEVVLFATDHIGGDSFYRISSVDVATAASK